MLNSPAVPSARSTANPLYMQAASSRLGSVGCHLARHTPPPMLTCTRQHGCKGMVGNCPVQRLALISSQPASSISRDKSKQIHSLQSACCSHLGLQQRAQGGPQVPHPQAVVV